MEQVGFAALAEAMVDGVYLLDADTAQIVWANREGCRRLGYTLEELQELSVAALNGADPAEFQWRVHVERMRRGGGRVIEATHVRRDGTRLPQEIAASLAVVGGREVVVSVCRDVEARKAVERQLAEVKEELLVASRDAGASEATASWLHTLGNLLTGLSTASAVLESRLGELPTGSLRRTADMLREHEGRLPAFFEADPRGAKLPPYLDALARRTEELHAELAHEARGLRDHVERVFEVIAVQREQARVGGLLQEVDPTEVARLALHIEQIELGRESITVATRLGRVPRLRTDKHRVLQILLNLLSNARNALVAAARPDPRLWFTVLAAKGGVGFEVRDNGIGIAPHNLRRVFEASFTTQDVGHGFGLHTSANAARLLGGSLSCASEGTGRGATFTLFLPTTSP